MKIWRNEEKRVSVSGYVAAVARLAMAHTFHEVLEPCQIQLASVMIFNAFTKFQATMLACPWFGRAPFSTQQDCTTASAWILRMLCLASLASRKVSILILTFEGLKHKANLPCLRDFVQYKACDCQKDPLRLLWHMGRKSHHHHNQSDIINICWHIS